jgi:hypothetical protein
MSYSYSVSGYLQVGLSYTYQLSKKWLAHGGINYQHISNGGLKEPNKGINWPTASIGLSYSKHPYVLPYYRNRVKRFEKAKPYLEAALLFTAKEGIQEGDRHGRTALAGLLLQGGKQVGLTNALVVGIESYYDNALYQKLKSDSVEGSAWRVGFLAGHDFLLGRFFFSQQLGVYLFHRSPYYDRVYHRWALRYKLNEKWRVGFALKAHRHVADFIDLRLIYRM